MLPNRIEMNKSILKCHSENRNSPKKDLTHDLSGKRKVSNSSHDVVSSVVNKCSKSYNGKMSENNSKPESKLHVKSYLSSSPSRIVSENKHVYENIDSQEEAIYQNMIFSEGKGLPQNQSAQQIDVSSHQISRTDLHTSSGRRPTSKNNFLSEVGVLTSNKAKNHGRTIEKRGNVKEVFTIGQEYCIIQLYRVFSNNGTFWIVFEI